MMAWSDELNILSESVVLATNKTITRNKYLVTCNNVFRVMVFFCNVSRNTIIDFNSLMKYFILLMILLYSLTVQFLSRSLCWKPTIAGYFYVPYLSDSKIGSPKAIFDALETCCFVVSGCKITNQCNEKVKIPQGLI
jgi:hypothetical protein